jgi:endonuclease/exonuclease/phosphatase family metal-dependent hydrolase
VSQFAALLTAPIRELRARRPRRRYTAWAQAAYLFAMLLGWWLLLTFSERWLPATLLAYGPRVVLLAPLALLVPAALFFSWRSLPFSLLGALVVAWPIMGYRPFGVRGEPPVRSTLAPGALRVMSLNAQGGAVVQSGVPYLFDTYDPDLFFFQECGTELANVLRALRDAHVVAERGLCLVSRWPVTQVDSMPRSTFEELRQLGYGGTALVTHYRIAHPDGPVHAVNLHLETARKGLEGLVGADGIVPNGGAEAIDRLDATVTSVAGTAAANAAVREAESRSAARWAFERRQCGPLIIAGDFNQPQESSIYRRHWRRFVNAFHEAGHGFGYTKFEGRLLRVRIDHILTLPEDATVLGAWVGADVGSDHRPVVVSLALMPSAGSTVVPVGRCG